MSFLKYGFLFTLLYSLCSARFKNPSLDHLKGSWIITNASKNAIEALGNCPSVDIEPPPKKSKNNTGKLQYNSVDKKYLSTIVPIDDTIYQLYYSAQAHDTLFGNVSVLTMIGDTMFLVELRRSDAIYFALLTNEKKATPDADKKIRKFLNSFPQTKDILLLPTNQKNCQEMSSKELRSGELKPEITGILTISTVSIEETEITDYDITKIVQSMTISGGSSQENSGSATAGSGFTPQSSVSSPQSPGSSPQSPGSSPQSPGSAVQSSFSSPQSSGSTSTGSGLLPKNAVSLPKDPSSETLSAEVSTTKTIDDKSTISETPSGAVSTNITTGAASLNTSKTDTTSGTTGKSTSVGQLVQNGTAVKPNGAVGIMCNSILILPSLMLLFSF